MAMATQTVAAVIAAIAVTVRIAKRLGLASVPLHHQTVRPENRTVPSLTSVSAPFISEPEK